MQARSVAKGTAAAVVALLACTAAGAAEPVDQKALPGSICVPANPNQAGSFRYLSGAIRNVGAATRNIECPVLRDGFSGGDDTVEELNVFIDQPKRGRTRCTVSVTDVRTGDDDFSRGNSGGKRPSRTDGQITKSVSKSGDRRLIFSSLKLTDNSILHLRCELPPQGRIRGILWEERLETDLDESFGALKGN